MSDGTSGSEESALVSLGWSAFFANQVPANSGNLEPARVIAMSRQSFETQSAVIKQSVRIRDAPRLDERPTTGDWLLCDRTTHEPLRLLKRKNVLQRRRSGQDHRAQTMLANFEKIFLVVSLNQNFNESRLERGLVLAAQSGVETIIVLTKIDQCADLDAFRSRLQYIPSLPSVHEVDARDATSCAHLASHLRHGETVALLGSSGVGKSTLINTLIGEARQATQSIRDQDAKGRHTTVRRTLIQLPSGAIVVDNPGVRELGIVDGEDAVATVFEDISNLAGQCRFANCQHDKEPACAVRAAIQEGNLDPRRFSNYVKLRLESKPSSTYS